MQMRIPEQHPTFADHFPTNPIVPGALLLKWLLDLISNSGYKVHELKSCKFKALVRPGDVGEVTLKHQSAEKCRFTMTVAGNLCLEGVVLVQPHDD